MELFKNDPTAFSLCVSVAYHRERPYRRPNGAALVDNRNPVWEQTTIPLEHEIRPPNDAINETRRLVLKRMSSKDYYDHELAIPDRCETWFRTWAAHHKLLFGQVAELLALLEQAKRYEFWKPNQLIPHRRIVAPGSWLARNSLEPRQGAERLFPALVAKGRCRNDPNPKRTFLEGRTHGETFGFQALFHYVLFVEQGLS